MFLSYFCLYSIILLFSLFFSSSTIAIGSNETDHEALLEFKSKINNDPFGVMTSWNDTTHFCQWYGVQCSSRNQQRVIALDLNSLKLSGSLPPHIGNLSFLKELYLQNNSFTHEIPPQIGRLRRLQRLYLFRNSFIGNIPVNISSCPLISLSLGYNQLVGEIPVEFGFLTGLRLFSVLSNQLTGAIPFSFGNLTSLDKLVLGTNNLSGSIPHTLGQLRNVTYIDLAENMLTGVIPPSIFNISSITGINLGANQLHGSLPADMGTTLPNLQTFVAVFNQFTGSIPPSISNNSNIVDLELLENRFTGKVPSLEKLHQLRWLSLSSNQLGSRGVDDDLSFLCSLTNITALQTLLIHYNNFGGMLPECIGNLSTNLGVLMLGGNHIFGSIPTGIENLVNLNTLGVWQNQLSGVIPPGIGKLRDLEKLFALQNNFSGHIPSSLGNLTKITLLDLSINNLEGSIPSSLGNCQKLLQFDLSNNNLSGVIPPEVLKVSSLSILLDLAQNHLTGTLPQEVGNLKHLGSLDVSGNKLSGEIPSSLASCVSLEALLLNGNHFQGTIPSSLSSLTSLKVLDFSHNNFSGEIPNFLTSFRSLSGLNLSYNDFDGTIPTEGIFKNVSAISIVGNDKLCGGIPELHLSACNFKKSGTRKLISKQKLVIVVVSVILGVTVVLGFLLILWSKKKRKEPTASDSKELLFRVSYQVLQKATDGFSATNLLGQGSFGSVYKGLLDKENTIVAVKVLSLSHKGAFKSFIAECEVLRNIRHRNLLKVLTACSSVDYHGNDFKALVYEFMINGSLEDWLHPVVRTNEANEAPRNLDFLQRLNIAIDVACAMEYLHHHCETPIIHCDLKPSNILLDKNMVAHVGDFGLAKVLSEGTPNYSTNQSSSVGVRGTVGYAPPEYGLGSEVSIRGDVYSFGIFLLEMFTGKKPTNDSFKDGLSLRNYVMLALPNQITEIVDLTFLQERAEEQTNTSNNSNQRSSRNERILDCLISIFQIGISCSIEMPRERLDMSKVVIELRSLRVNFLQT